MNLNDFVGWAGLVIAILGFPLVYGGIARRLRSWQVRYRFWRGSFVREPDFKVQVDGERRTYQVINPGPMTMRSTTTHFLGLDVPGPMPSGTTVNRGNIGVGESFEAIPPDDMTGVDSLFVGWQYRGRSRDARWWEFWVWRKLSYYRIVKLSELGD
ncbi:hypothetical protein ACPPVQ_10780 [Diaminobutyricibacter sp. McL0618]|uniref:hypothetical protein n=1 Tax=Leifsonia sp. McL0618 TaxID=3415677 RepID=UPI003CF1BC5D